MRGLMLAGLMLVCGVASAEQGKATYYTRESTIAEGNPGVVTASGEEYDERAFTAAMRRRDFGGDYLVCRTDGSGRCVIVRHIDYGPGKAAARRGIVIDLSPAAFDALGGQRGVNKRGIAWGEITVEVEAL
jgi:rare lipoprotein A (peptidoglycan hydrolase)